MRTTIVNSQDANAYARDLSAAAAALKAGGLVIFPTETVYGVGTNATVADAVARLRAAKGRGEVQPFTVHLGQRRHARRYLTAPSPLVRRFIRKGWPGPLTLVVPEPAPEKTEIAQVVPPEQLTVIFYAGSVGLRCPDHPATTRLLGDPDVPVVASSANRHGNPPPLDLRDALRDLDGQVEYAIDAGRTRFNTASTIVEVRANEWKVLRPGAVDERALERMSRSEVLFVCTGNSCRSPMAEYMFRERLAQRLGGGVEELAALGYRVLSAGVGAGKGGRASPGALEEMQRRGMDLAAHRSQPVTVELLHRAERVFVMSAEQRQAVIDLVPAAAGRVELLDPQGPVADPFGASDAEYRRAADQIRRAVDLRLEEFLDEDRNW